MMLELQGILVWFSVCHAVICFRNQRTSSASESVPKPSSIIVSNDSSPIADTPGPSPPPAKQEFEDFDEFDPRVSVPGTGKC